MSIADKQVLIKDFEFRIGEILTVSQKTEVMRLLVEELDKYSVEANALDDGYDSDDLVEAFFDAKEIEGCSTKSLKYYSGVIKRFRRKINVPLKKITVYHLRGYLKNYLKTGVTDTTAENVRSVLSSFFKWLYNEHLIDTNPCANLGTIKCQKVVKQPYSEVEFEKIKESCKTDRDKAIVMFLMSTGCRIEEMCSLNKDSIDFKEGECVVHGKGNKERMVYLDSVALLYLKRYLDSRTDDIPALFIGKRKERFLPDGVRRMLRGVQKRCGVGRVHPHKFRRTFTTNLINRGMPIQDVAVLLGHSKLDTTMQYAYIDRRTLKNTYRKFA